MARQALVPPNSYDVRVKCTLDVPYLGTPEQRARQERSDETYVIELNVIEASFDRGNFAQADSASVVCDWAGSGLDPRVLDDAVMTLWIGFAENGFWVPSDDDCVFIGHVTNVEKNLEEGEAPTLSIEAVDYTDLYLKNRPFGSRMLIGGEEVDGIPKYSDTIREAWQRICKATPGTEVLADRLVAIGGVNLNTRIGSAVADRFSGLASVPFNPGADAWAVWEYCVGMLGLISYIDKDYCIVTTSTDLYTDNTAITPVFTWGSNLAKLRECRRVPEFKCGVAIVAFDPLRGKALEIFYPPIGDKNVLKKQVRARAVSKRKPKVHQPALSDEYQKRTMLTFVGVYDEEQLKIIAERVYNQLSRQEFSGRLETPHLLVPTAGGEKLFNVLQLKAGDSIKVKLLERTFIASIKDEQLRVAALRKIGYTQDVALLLARNAEALAELGDLYYVDGVTGRVSISEDGGDFSCEVRFCNKISVTEGAVS